MDVISIEELYNLASLQHPKMWRYLRENKLYYIMEFNKLFCPNISGTLKGDLIWRHKHHKYGKATVIIIMGNITYIEEG